MRQILFRGKCIDNGEWIEGWYCKYPFGRWPLKHSIIPSEDAENGSHSFGEVDPTTVGQFTGLLDTNGNKIFEGDIVTGADFDEEDGYAKIVWDEKTARFSIEAKSVAYDFDNYRGNEIEVIGNIYDNPELIEEDNNG